jgi:tetratricopeptide (TPR) repeat protein
MSLHPQARPIHEIRPGAWRVVFVLLAVVLAGAWIPAPSLAAAPTGTVPPDAAGASGPDSKEPVQAPLVDFERDTKPAFNTSLSSVTDPSALPDQFAPGTMPDPELLSQYVKQLETARYYRTTRQWHEAEPVLIELLAEFTPDAVKQSALLELAALAQDANNLSRAQQIYSQFLGKWPNDLRVPEILLRQGLLFRRMGLNNLAFTKFYSVMTSALVLKNDRLDYYARLVLQAQMEIAETHYELGKYAEAADFFSRLLKQDNPAVNKSYTLYKLVRCHASVGKYAEAIAGAQDFLIHYPDAPEQPEIRFHLALALRQRGRNNESLQQVLLLLQEQRLRTKDRPEVWAYWQQRAGNIIANQLYREGDYAQALEIYLNLAQLDRSPQWQLPVQYQIGMTYERLLQPQKATEAYARIVSRDKELGNEIAPSLKTILEMARWRISFIEWQGKAEAANRRLREEAPATASLPAPAPFVP